MQTTYVGSWNQIKLIYFYAVVFDKYVQIWIVLNLIYDTASTISLKSHAWWTYST